MLITLEEWASRNFSRPCSLNTLRAWARSGQIFPPPVKVGRQYQVEESAQYVPLRQNKDVPKLITQDPVVEEILKNGTCAAK